MKSYLPNRKQSIYIDNTYILHVLSEILGSVFGQPDVFIEGEKLMAVSDFKYLGLFSTPI